MKRHFCTTRLVNWVSFVPNFDHPQWLTWFVLLSHRAGWLERNPAARSGEGSSPLQRLQDDLPGSPLPTVLKQTRSQKCCPDYQLSTMAALALSNPTKVIVRFVFGLVFFPHRTLYEREHNTRNWKILFFKKIRPLTPSNTLARQPTCQPKRLLDGLQWSWRQFFSCSFFILEFCFCCCIFFLFLSFLLPLF